MHSFSISDLSSSYNNHLSQANSVTLHISSLNTHSNQYNISALNLVLQYAVSSDDPDICRGLIAANADPNALDASGKTALNIAIQSREWFTVKALIDNGANVHSNDRDEITKYLDNQGVVKHLQSIYFVPFPNPDMLEIFVNNRFLPFFEGQFTSVTNNSVGVALFNISDEPPSVLYSGMGEEYSQDIKRQKENYANYKLLNKYGIVVIRARVDSSEKLSTLIDKVEDALPQLPIIFWALKCHGQWNEMLMGRESRINFNNVERIAEDITSKLDDTCKLTFIACSTADRHIGNAHADVNIASQFSIYANNRQIYASSQSVTHMILNMYSLPPSPMPQFVSFFKNVNSSHELNLVAYQDGKCIVDENKHRKNAIKQCMLASIQTYQQEDVDADGVAVKRLAGTNSWTVFTEEHDPFEDLYYQNIESYCDVLSDSEDDSDSETNIWNQF